MNGVTGVQGSGSFYSRAQVDPAKDIRFENALAAARTVESNTKSHNPDKGAVDQVDLGAVLPATKQQPSIPGAKMIQSLNKLVQNNPTDNFGQFDIKQ